MQKQAGMAAAVASEAIDNYLFDLHRESTEACSGQLKCTSHMNDHFLICVNTYGLSDDLDSCRSIAKPPLIFIAGGGTRPNMVLAGATGAGSSAFDLFTFNGCEGGGGGGFG